MHTLRVISRVALVFVACGMLCGLAPHPQRGPQQGQIRITSQLSGQISGAIVDGRVPVLGVGTGRAGRFGRITMQALWAPTTEAVRQLMMGEVDELFIGAGDFSAELEDGGTLTGTLSGIVRRLGRTKIAMTCDFVVTEATGSLAGTTGGGTFRGWADLRTRDFRVTFDATLSRP